MRPTRCGSGFSIHSKNNPLARPLQEDCSFLDIMFSFLSIRSVMPGWDHPSVSTASRATRTISSSIAIRLYLSVIRTPSECPSTARVASIPNRRRTSVAKLCRSWWGCHRATPAASHARWIALAYDSAVHLSPGLLRASGTRRLT